MSADTWNPEQYARFRDERSRPFYELMALVKPKPGMRILDLGCGTGELTRELHRHTGASETVGLDSSPAMLEKARSVEGSGLRFAEGDIVRVAAAEGELVTTTGRATDKSSAVRPTRKISGAR